MPNFFRSRAIRPVRASKTPATCLRVRPVFSAMNAMLSDFVVGRASALPFAIVSAPLVVWVPREPPLNFGAEHNTGEKAMQRFFRRVGVTARAEQRLGERGSASPPERSSSAPISQCPSARASRAQTARARAVYVRPPGRIISSATNARGGTTPPTEAHAGAATSRLTPWRFACGRAVTSVKERGKRRSTRRCRRRSALRCVAAAAPGAGFRGPHGLQRAQTTRMESSPSP